MIPTAIILIATIVFFVAERTFPGRELPEAPGWYARAASLNLAQLAVVLIAGVAWNQSPTSQPSSKVCSPGSSVPSSSIGGIVHVINSLRSGESFTRSTTARPASKC
jgi:hypothetical protein